MLKESVTAALPADMVFILNRVESGVRSISAFVKLDLMQGCQIEKYCCWFAYFVAICLCPCPICLTASCEAKAKNRNCHVRISHETAVNYPFFPLNDVCPLYVSFSVHITVLSVSCIRWRSAVTGIREVLSTCKMQRFRSST